MPTEDKNILCAPNGGGCYGGCCCGGCSVGGDGDGDGGGFSVIGLVMLVSKWCWC